MGRSGWILRRLEEERKKSKPKNESWKADSSFMANVLGLNRTKKHW